MRQTLLAAVAAFIIGGASVGAAALSYAQPAPAAPSGPTRAPAAWQQPRRGGMTSRHEMWRRRRATFALIYTQSDRRLTPDDVRKIAEGLLLWHGNHDWKVVDVAPQSDGAIGFSLATQSGSVIAKFSMDPHSGRVTRLG